MRDRLHIVLLLCAAHVVFAATASGQIFELPRENFAPGDYFGTAVAIDGDRVLIGATGVASCGSNSGAAFIYEREEGAWRLTSELLPSTCVAGKFFGRSVSLSGDVAVVSSSQEFFSREDPNAAYVFEYDATTGRWHETARLTGGSAADEGAFATSVSVHGFRVLVTTSGDPVRGRFGGAAYVFERQDGTWLRAARLTGSGDTRRGIFGTTGVVHGDVVAVSASTFFQNRPGSVYIFEYDEGEWTERALFGDVEDFFISLDADEGRIIAGEGKSLPDRSGSATIYERREDGTWHAASVLRPGKPYRAGAFGTAVALHADYALIVGFDEQLGLDFNVDRVVFVFRRNPETDTWVEQHVIDVGESSFGAAVDLHGRYAVIGSADDFTPGAAYVVRVPDWSSADRAPVQTER